MGFWAEMAAAVPAATGNSGGGRVSFGDYKQLLAGGQEYVRNAQAKDPEWAAYNAKLASTPFDSIDSVGPSPGTNYWDQYLGTLSPTQQAGFQQHMRDSRSWTDSVTPFMKMIPAAVGAVGLAGAAGALGAGGGFPGTSIFGGAEAGLSGGGATGLDFGSAFEGLANGGGGATGLDFGASAEGLGGLPEWASGGSFNNPSLVSMPDVSPGMLSGQFNNPAFVSIPGLEGGSISAADAAAGGAAGSQAGGPSERPMSASSFSLESVLPQLMNFGQGGWGMPAVRTIAGLYGLLESRKLKKLGQLPNPGDITGMPGYQAGLEAVRRSMASQGFQGSGNMMAALQKYGGDFYNQYVGQRLASQQAQSGPVSGGMSSLALLASGLGGFYGR